MDRPRMRCISCITFLLAMCSSLAATKAGEPTPADPVGAWKLKCTSPDGKRRECVVHVSRAGSTLEATCTADGVDKPARNVSFKHGEMSFRVDGAFAGQAYALTYKGKPLGDEFKGTVRWSYGWVTGSFPFSGERVTAKIASNP